MSTLEEDLKNLAIGWSECGGTHSDEVVSDIFSLVLQHFPGWSPDSEEAQHYIDYIKRT